MKFKMNAKKILSINPINRSLEEKKGSRAKEESLKNENYKTNF